MPAHLSIVTGASRGLGAAIARQLIARGHRVLGLSRTVNPGLDAEAAAHATRCEQWRVDLAEPQPVAVRLEAWLREQGDDAFDSATLVNNAAMVARSVPLERSDAHDLAAALRVGLEAPMLLTAAFLRATATWRARRDGHCKVLNISSGLGRRAMASTAAYCAAKAGLDHFTRAVALDQAAAAHGARVVSLAPGVIDTDMQVQLRGSDPAHFPDHARFVELKTGGALASPEAAASRIVAYLDRDDFGAQTVADVRDA